MKPPLHSGRLWRFYFETSVYKCFFILKKVYLSSLSLFFFSFSCDLQEGKWHFCFTHLVLNSVPCILLVFKMYLWSDRMNGLLLASAYFWFLLSYNFSLIRPLIAPVLTPYLWHWVFLWFCSRYGLVPDAGPISWGEERKKTWQPRLLP